MCVHTYMSKCVRRPIYNSVYVCLLFMYVYVSRNVCVYVVYVFMNVCMYLFMYVSMYMLIVCVCVCVCVSVCVCVCVSVYVFRQGICECILSCNLYTLICYMLSLMNELVNYKLYMYVNASV